MNIIIKRITAWWNSRRQKGIECISKSDDKRVNRFCRQDEIDFVMKTSECNESKSTEESWQDWIEEINNKLNKMSIDKGKEGCIKTDPCIINYNSDEIKFRSK